MQQTSLAKKVNVSIDDPSQAGSAMLDLIHSLVANHNEATVNFVQVTNSTTHEDLAKISKTQTPYGYPQVMFGHDEPYSLTVTVIDGNDMEWVTRMVSAGQDITPEQQLILDKKAEANRDKSRADEEALTMQRKALAAIPLS